MARGYVSVEAAAREYGVVLVDGTIDEAATAALRDRMKETQTGEHFHFGPEREAYEALWTAQVYDQMTDLLAALPVHWRFFVKTELFARLGKTADTLTEAFAQVRIRFPQVPDVEMAAEDA